MGSAEDRQEFPVSVPEGAIIGVNYSGMHDTSAVVVSPEGEVLYAISLERLTRIKQDGRSPKRLLEGVPWENVSKVAISVSHTYAPPENFKNSYHPVELREKLRPVMPHSKKFGEQLDFIPVEKIFVPHHLAHAASAFWMSGFSDATCLVYDGGMSNEEWFGGVFDAKTDGGVSPDEYFSASCYSNITKIYTAITVLLGFKPLKHEGKITGLAANGKPSNECRSVLEKWLHEPAILDGLLVWEHMYDDFLVPRLSTVPGVVEKLKKDIKAFSDADVAASVQAIAEEHVCSILKRMRLQKNTANLCLSGGLFANVKLNQRASEVGFDHLFISPPMSDDGTALGAALHVAAASNTNFSFRPMDNVYWGPSFGYDEVAAAISDSGTKATTTETTAHEVAQLLEEGAIVAVFNGSMEFGPRSLGNRSILAKADNYDINRKLNGLLNRTEFMPFAPICCEEDGHRLFTGIDKIWHSAHFMTVTVDCTKEMSDLHPAVVHVDGTARPQLVSKKSNPFLHSILSNYKALSGRFALVNTSFNIHEEPIIMTPAEAIKGFYEAGIDALVLNNTLIKRSDNSQAELNYVRDKLKVVTSAIKLNREEAYALSVETYSAEERALEAEERALQAEVELSETSLALKLKIEECVQLHQRLEDLQNQQEATKLKIEELREHAQHWQSIAAQVSLDLQSLIDSKSWRVTSPLRKLLDVSACLAQSLIKPIRSLSQLCSMRLHNAVTKYKQDTKRIAVVGPGPGEKVGAADYIEAVARMLSNKYSLEFISDVDHLPELPEPFTRKSTAFFTQNYSKYSRVIYQIGNHPAYKDSIELASRLPGIVILHDVHLGHFYQWLQGDSNDTSWNHRLGNELGYQALCLRARFGDNWAAGQFPLLLEVLSHSLAVIVHSPQGRERLMTSYPKSMELPTHLLPQPYTRPAKYAANPKKFLSSGLTVACFGHITQYSMAKEIIGAWGNSLAADAPDVKLVFVGDCQEAGLKGELLELVENQPSVSLLGFVDRSDYDRHLEDAQVAVILRSAHFGESSRTIIETLASGTPTITNRPMSICNSDAAGLICLDPDVTVETSLTDIFNQIMEGNICLEELAQKALDYTTETQGNIKEKLIELIEGASRHAYKSVDTKQNNNPLSSKVADESLGRFASNDLFPTERLPIPALPTLYIDITDVAQNGRRTGIQRVVRGIFNSLATRDQFSVRIIPVCLVDTGGFWHFEIAHQFMTEHYGDHGWANSHVTPKAGDSLLFLDFIAGEICEAHKSGLLSKLTSAGVIFHTVVYDLLPLSHQSLFPPNTSTAHQEWLEIVASLSDRLLCISEATGQELRQFLSSHKSSTATIDVFRLGSDLAASLPSKSSEFEYPFSLNASDEALTFLMVGTIEPRKGYDEVLEAFEELWARGFDYHLIIVGKEGWHTESLVARFHDLAKSDVFTWLSSANDHLLERIYQRADCLIAASIAEGYGLPLVEGAFHSVPLLARDIPVFREVAGDGAYFWSGGNSSKLAQEILEWVDLYSQGLHPQPEKVERYTWEDSAADILSLLAS